MRVEEGCSFSNSSDFIFCQINKHIVVSGIRGFGNDTENVCTRIFLHDRCHILRIPKDFTVDDNRTVVHIVGHGKIDKQFFAKEMLAEKQAVLRERIKEIEVYIDFIDYKQNFYYEVLSGVKPYTSNLLRLEDETEDRTK